jgi:hypothetical protein
MFKRMWGIFSVGNFPIREWKHWALLGNMSCFWDSVPTYLYLCQPLYASQRANYFSIFLNTETSTYIVLSLYIFRRTFFLQWPCTDKQYVHYISHFTVYVWKIVSIRYICRYQPDVHVNVCQYMQFYKCLVFLHLCLHVYLHFINKCQHSFNRLYLSRYTMSFYLSTPRGPLL